MASLHHNLAGLLHIQGQHLKAEPDIHTALELRRSAQPPDRVGIAADLSVLGAVWAGQGRFEEAKQSLETALRMWESLCGPQHYEVAVQLYNLASIHIRRPVTQTPPASTSAGPCRLKSAV
ncbi:tetratricopeptide repeat protein [Pseudarthrobacter sp. S3]|uniref:tetratricopeptide repeat protein n=1 Tax=unclassified Pseudarthrobacter TaxID=2647000 RepID=UPI003CF8126C